MQLRRDGPREKVSGGLQGWVGEGAPAERGMEKSRAVRPGLGERGKAKEEEGRRENKGSRTILYTLTLVLAPHTPPITA